jgi:hypothetical protein
MHRMNRIACRTAVAVALLVTWQPRPSLGGTPCLAFTEIMNNPAAVPDASGEWFEIANYSSMVLNLVGLTIADGVGGSFTIARALMVNPGGMLVFGRSTDPVANGGLPRVDYQFSGIALGNAGGVLNLSEGATLIDGVSYPAGTAGRAYACSVVDASANDNGANWYEASTPYGNGDLGTPGGNNEIMTFGACEVTAVETAGVLERLSFLGLPQPNPSHSGTWIPCRSGSSGAMIHVVSVSGRTVRVLPVTGAGLVFWDLKDDGGRRVPPGIYLLRGVGFASPVNTTRVVTLP